MLFRNLTDLGKEFTVEEIVLSMLAFIDEDPEHQYRIIVGTDSLYRARKTCFSTAVIIHRVGRCARLFYSKYFIEKYPRDIVPRIMKEVQDSIDIITKLQDTDLVFSIDDDDWQVDIDAGNNGDSTKVVHQAMSYVKAMGFHGECKPNSAIATNVADRYTGH